MEHLKPTTRKLIIVAIAAVVGLCATLQLVYGGKPMSKIDEPVSQSQPVEEVPDVQTTPVEAVEPVEPVQAQIEPAPAPIAPQTSPEDELLASYGWNTEQQACMKEILPLILLNDKPLNRLQNDPKRAYYYIKMRYDDPCLAKALQDQRGWL